MAIRRGRVDAETQRQRSAAAVREHAGDWRAWAVRAVTPGISRDERRAAIEQAQRIEPERGEVLGEAAFEALLDAHWTEAEAFARRAALLLPSSVRPRALWFTAFERLGNCDAARAVVNNAPALAPELPGVVRRLFASLALDGPRCALP
jgi:Flp pilus assembly protein TadD